MKVKAHFSGLMSQDVGKEFLDELRKIVPDGRGNTFGYLGKVHVNDPRYQHLCQRLEIEGLVPWTERHRERNHQREYMLEFHREYEPSDFIDCEYLVFEPHISAKVNMGENVNDMLSLNDGELDPKRSFLRTPTYFLCSDRARLILEQQNFVGLSFKPTAVRQRLEENWREFDTDRMGDAIPWDQWGPPWWQMMTDRVMPSLSPLMTFVKSRLKEYELVHPPLTDPNYCYTPHDGLYTPVELHFRRSDLQTAGLTDYARTLEKLGATYYPIIVSKHFYDCCADHDLQSDWVPVRIDED